MNNLLVLSRSEAEFPRTFTIIFLTRCEGLTGWKVGRRKAETERKYLIRVEHFVTTTNEVARDGELWTSLD